MFFSCFFTEVGEERCIYSFNSKTLEKIVFFCKKNVNFVQNLNFVKNNFVKNLRDLDDATTGSSSAARSAQTCVKSWALRIRLMRVSDNILIFPHDGECLAEVFPYY